MLANLGDKVTEEEISDMIKEVDLDGDGKVNSPYAVIGRR